MKLDSCDKILQEFEFPFIVIIMWCDMTSREFDAVSLTADKTAVSFESEVLLYAFYKTILKILQAEWRLQLLMGDYNP